MVVERFAVAWWQRCAGRLYGIAVVGEGGLARAVVLEARYYPRSAYLWRIRYVRRIEFSGDRVKVSSKVVREGESGVEEDDAGLLELVHPHAPPLWAYPDFLEELVRVKGVRGAMQEMLKELREMACEAVGGVDL